MSGLNKHSSSKLAFSPRIFHCINDSAIILCPKEDFPIETGAKLTWTPPPPYPHRSEGQTCCESGLGHYTLFQIYPQCYSYFSGGLRACWLEEVWGSKPHRCPPTPLPSSPAHEVSRGYAVFCFLFWRPAEPLSADCDGSAEPAGDIAGADPAADCFKGSAKPSLFSRLSTP